MNKYHQKIWGHLNRMQKRVMAADSQVTRTQFAESTHAEKIEYYEWMRQQCGSLCDLI